MVISHVSVLFFLLWIFCSLKGVSWKDPASFWTGWGPLCNLVNTGALRVGNVSESCAEL